MSNNNWKIALKRVSLMGLNATKIAPELKKFFKSEKIKGDQAQQILAGISLMSLQERGHFQFKKAAKKNQLTPFPKEQEFISQYQNGVLSQILNKEFQWSMYEFITIIKAQNLLISAARIPDLINYGLSETWFKPWIEELTGLQGAWALSHIPRWEKRYGQIQSGHWFPPKSIEKKIFPLLNLSSPIPNLMHILPLLEFPALIWSEKLSQRMYKYIEACLKLPNIDIHTQDDLETVIHFTSYLSCLTKPTLFAVEDYNKDFVATLIRHNRTLKFRNRLKG